MKYVQGISTTAHAHNPLDQGKNLYYNSQEKNAIFPSLSMVFIFIMQDN